MLHISKLRRTKKVGRGARGEGRFYRYLSLHDVPDPYSFETDSSNCSVSRQKLQRFVADSARDFCYTIHKSGGVPQLP